MAETQAMGTAVKEVLTPAELADVIGCKRTKVYELPRQREIPSYKVGRLTRILRKDVERWREEQKTPQARRPQKQPGN